MAEHFGEHITIDGYDGSPERLNSRDVVYTALVELCEELKMQRLIDPQVIEAPDNQLKDPGGWSGYVIIAESHISIHTFPKRRFISADVYTCQNGIDREFVVEFFRRKFELGEVEVNFIKRGLKYPKYDLV